MQHSCLTQLGVFALNQPVYDARAARQALERLAGSYFAVVFFGRSARVPEGAGRVLTLFLLQGPNGTGRDYLRSFVPFQGKKGALGPCMILGA